MPSPVTPPSLFPPLSPSSILAFQFSSWYSRFSAVTIKSSVIRPLTAEFKEYLDSEGVFLPEGSEDVPAESYLSDDEGDGEEDEDDEEKRKTFAFPAIDEKIRDAVKTYGAVFPKLNFSSPRDAAWMLPASSPLKCTSPADVYLLLKSSDFVLHDLDTDSVFDGVESVSGDRPSHPYELELVLRKWYPVDRSRELRCFVRREMIIGISQRDPNYYDFWNDVNTRTKVVDAVIQFWEENLKGKWEATDGNYTFDLLLTRDLSRGHVIDFNPYAPRTDPLLFTYDDLFELLKSRISSITDSPPKPEFRVIDSRTHPAASRNAPTHQHNMVPIEALAMGHGRNIQEFSEAWEQEVRRAVVEDD
ncbi:D123-domain-containing protein [Cristinia sonorae]|uniref:D123-domain-containing protein n=1 Tax=Cristinia sonorae TaxID=1940300 RepID=A0A8K0US40_9AGAR|nr:D123-domain-containing protein [Cristinia sonorae]